MTKAFSDKSRTNQLQILMKPEEVAEKLFLYLFSKDTGIEHFIPEYPVSKDESSQDEDSQTDYYKKRHKFIKNQIKNGFL